MCMCMCMWCVYISTLSHLFALQEPDILVVCQSFVPMEIVGLKGDTV